MAITFGSGQTVIDYRWKKFKSITLSKRVDIQYCELDNYYTAFGFDGPIVYVCDVYKNATDIDSTYLAAEVAEDYADFLVYKHGLNSPINKRSADGKLKVAVEKSTNAKYTFISHNFCDKTTWYSDAVRVVLGTATDSGNHTRFNLPHTYIIDTCHAKLTREDQLVSRDGYSYRVSVFVDGVEKTEQDPHFASGGDFLVDYAGGFITFLTPLDVGLCDKVRATYHYATTSIFKIRTPIADRDLQIDSVEVQISEDIVLNDSFEYQIYLLADIAAPGVYPPGTMIPYQTPIVYKSVLDFLNDCNQSFPKYPALSTTTWRGTQSAAYVFDWNYVSSEEVPCAMYGAEIWMRMSHDVPNGGSFSTATFYCLITDDKCHGEY
jgi:hypothetical protein